MIDFSAFDRADVTKTPFRFMSTSGALTGEAAANIRRDYPAINKSGFLPLSKLDSRGAFSELIDDLQSTQLAEALSDKLALDLRDKPRMITVRRLSKIGDGRIHNDSISKICTMLIYLNKEWAPEQSGAIRALKNEHDIDDYLVEIPPLAGNIFAFARADNSWHGHLPFEGERLVVQTTFLSSQDELDRKENRGGIQLFLKRVNPFSR
ncbi:MAG: 2OG-Fe(II) oxygenase [Pseudomonadota bacterium]